MSQPATNSFSTKQIKQDLTPAEEFLCPNCGEEISLSEALRSRFTEQFEKELKMKEKVAAALFRQKEELLAKKAKLLEEDISRRLSESMRLKMAEKDKQLADMRKKMEEASRETTSQQLQGEVLELELETTLKRAFPIDTIEPVAKGVRGGDIIHKILSSGGQTVGTIVYEAKRTKNWSELWIDKIKEDQRAISAECAVIVSDILPKNINGMGLHFGVWVCDTKTALGLATALRFSLLQLNSAKASVAGKDAKMELMYRYLTGTQFFHCIQAMVETFRDMKDSLQKEKTAYQRIWAQREKQLEEVVLNTASVYGSIQGVVGGALPTIETLELTGSKAQPTPAPEPLHFIPPGTYKIL